jgi:hypothetical protein
MDSQEVEPQSLWKSLYFGHTKMAAERVRNRAWKPARKNKPQVSACIVQGVDGGPFDGGR